MKQWDTFNCCEFAHGKHPCIVISPTDRCQYSDFQTVNVLACQSHRAQRLPRENELLSMALMAWIGKHWSAAISSGSLGKAIRSIGVGG